MKIASCVLCVLFSLAVPASQAQLSSIPHFEVDPSGTDSLQSFLNSISDPASPGFSVLVGTPDSIWVSFQSGVRDLNSHLPLTKDTPIYIASIGKTFTTFAIFKLVESKQLSLSDKVSTYFPEISSLGTSMTVMHLLSHQSGIPDYYDTIGDVDRLTNTDVLESLRAPFDLEFPPGTNYAYSNTAFVLLAEIIEQVSGQSFGQFLRSTFFEPLEMSHTWVGDESGMPVKNAAVGYTISDDGSWVEADRSSMVTGPGAIYSTVQDLYVWYRAMVKYKLVSKALTELPFQMPVTQNGHISYMNMGWFNETFGRKTPRFEGMRVFGSIGNYRGFQSMLSIFPEQNLVFIVLSTSGSYPLGPLEVASMIIH